MKKLQTSHSRPFRFKPPFKPNDPALELRPRIYGELSSSALTQNYEAIRKLVPGHSILPMVKANAYGHGVAWVAPLLMRAADLYGFGVATLEEGIELRGVLGVRGRKIPIIVFSDTYLWDDQKGEVFLEYSLCPVIASEEDWLLFSRSGWAEKVSYELQFNTGMNRLGIAASFAKKIAKELSDFAPDAHPRGVFSHLAMSEEPDSQATQTQLKRFIEIKSDLIKVLPSTHFHLANSGGVWNAQKLGLQNLTDVVRPGLSLYGIPPWAGAPQRGLQPVMTLKTRVQAIHRLKAGDFIGYGASYRVKGDNSVRAAILSAGYGDGVMRSLGNQGYAWVGGKTTRFIGRVSMDLCAVQCWEETQVGDEVELFGSNLSAWQQANAAGTIPYELFTSLSSRVRRIHD